MERGAKSAKAKVEARPTVTRKSRKIDGLYAAGSSSSASRRRWDSTPRSARSSQVISRFARATCSRCWPPSPSGPPTCAMRRLRKCYSSKGMCFAQPSRIGPMLAQTRSYDDSRGVKRTWPVTRRIMSGRAVLDCETVHYADVVPSARLCIVEPPFKRIEGTDRTRPRLCENVQRA